MGGARNYLQDWMNGDLEEEETFEPIHTSQKRKEMAEEARRREKQKIIDQKRSEQREHKEERLSPEEPS